MHPGFSKTASDLTAVLADLARNIEKQFRVACIFQCDNSRYEFPESVVNNLYRITQEAVLNGIKHGDARRIEIALARTDKAIQLAVKNDGTSFDPRKNAGHGMGLRIMNYRARAIGATVSIRGIQPPGTLLTCSLPL
jgi:signal transduction histidine kinase